MNKKIYQFGDFICNKIPALAPFAVKFYHDHLLGAKFTGWGMKTEHEPPWNDRFSKDFNQDCKDLQNFQLTESSSFKHHNLHELKWIHWNVHFSIVYALKFAKSNEYNFVECGVADGLTAFIALREISRYKKRNPNFTMHLYDAWGPMRKDLVLKSEEPARILQDAGKYSDLSFERTKKNLREFDENIIYHKGYIPDSFNEPPEPPNSIMYLHIDLNASIPTLDALNYFWPRLAQDGIILFDDYGWNAYEDTKSVVDEFTQKKAGVLLKLPTGQAIYYN